MSDALALEPDHSTGLPRYRQALNDLARLIQTRPTARCLGLVVFRLVQDPTLLRLPPEATERLRAEISGRLSSRLRTEDRLYALDSWEWLVILHDLPSSAPVTLAMIQFRRLFFQPPLSIGGCELGLNAVCGGAVSPEHGTDPQHLIQSARIATLMTGQEESWTALYSPEMEQGEEHHQNLVSELQEALVTNDLQLYLQPQVNIDGGHCSHVEALLRWQRRNGEWIQPPLLVTTMERAGLRHSFNRWLFQHAALCLTRLREVHIDVRFSVNLTAHDLLDPEIPDLIAQALAVWQLPPTSLMLEITETVAVKESSEVIDVLRRLRLMGMALSIDDFGTGYAGMAYLQHLPVQEVKIDQRFVLPMENSPRDREIIASIIGLAHRLGLEVVAEGVETAGALALLAQLGCERAQGYLFSPALAPEEFIRWWQNRTLA